MSLDNRNLKKIRRLIVFTAAVLLAVIYSKDILNTAGVLLGMLTPFLIGAAMAFVLSIPMEAIEKGVFGRIRHERFERLKRPFSLLCTFVLLIGLLLFAVMTVVPQLGRTMTELANRIPVFIDNVLRELERLCASNPEIVKELSDIQRMTVDWKSALGGILDFLKNGVGNVVLSTFNVAGSIIGGVVNVFIALVFAVYILLQKEKLGDQFRRVFAAYLPARRNEQLLKVCSLLSRNFSHFITGQCLEAVILGTMFTVTMTVFRFPYALLVGVLIAFTALIPIVGAFIGCFVGAFLIMVDDPVKAVWFVVLFLVLQQIEGNLIYPHVVGNSVGLPSIWVLAAVTIGGSMLGILGMLVFIPLISTCYCLLREDVNMRNSRSGRKRDGGG